TGLLLPTATNSVVGSVPQGEAGVGSATNTVALQVGGALGVAIIGSVMLTRYQNHMTTALSGRSVPTPVSQAILGSVGGALAVAKSTGGATGALLAHAARAAFMNGNETSLAVGAAVALGGALLVLAALPRWSSDYVGRNGSAERSPLRSHAASLSEVDRPLSGRNSGTSLIVVAPPSCEDVGNGTHHAVEGRHISAPSGAEIRATR
ncbi:MAG: hypothetical protein ABSE47_18010, partial [Acidimicrobiales bacterium]